MITQSRLHTSSVADNVNIVSHTILPNNKMELILRAYCRSRNLLSWHATLTTHFDLNIWSHNFEMFQQSQTFSRFLWFGHVVQSFVYTVFCMLVSNIWYLSATSNNRPSQHLLVEGLGSLPKVHTYSVMCRLYLPRLLYTYSLSILTLARSFINDPVVYFFPKVHTYTT